VALDLARRSVAQAKDVPESLSSLAAIEAEAGELDRAIEDHWKAMELRGSFEPNGAEWYITGRINEQLGLRDDAAAAYRRVTRDITEPMSSYDLAQARLAALRHP
jgi:tetratricopeptide (TPR) repeat protein